MAWLNLTETGLKLLREPPRGRQGDKEMLTWHSPQSQVSWEGTRSRVSPGRQAPDMEGSVAFPGKFGSLVLELSERRRNTQVAPCLLSIERTFSRLLYSPDPPPHPTNSVNYGGWLRGKGACQVAWQPEFNHWDPHDRRLEPTLASCSLTILHIHTHTHKYKTIYL